ncbi:putative protein kinase RLK-Pelle-CrRLK1L-1 family [Helianthus annuus]|nr:putative protein kinase RLK-Pelle-CrRLK1L-1 family [Helianthus annuus]
MFIPLSSIIMFFSTVDGKGSHASTMQPCRHFDFPEILIATKNFDESLVIGTGGFGKVYKGNIIIGASLVVAAIKRLDSMSNQGAVEFWAEVEMLSMLRHCNLVTLIGYCNYEKEMILVYEYIPNGTLDDHLHKLHSPLTWIQRLNICIGAGRGLHYLHTSTGIESGVIHRDVKSSNILLHENWAAKISDFGLSKISPMNQPSTYVNTLVKGTFGYMDPNYYATGKLTKKSDVYAFGVVLLEVLCRKRAVDRSLDEEQWGLVTWFQDSIKEGNLKHIIDLDIRGEISPKCLKEFIRIIQRCLHHDLKQRPTMAEVLFSLESVLALQEKFENSLQLARRTIIGRIVDMLPFTSKGENSVQGVSKLSSGSRGNNMFSEMKEVLADFQSPSPSQKVFKFSDLEKATNNFSVDLLLGEGLYGKVFLGWVEQDTLAPSTQGVGTAVAIKRVNQESLQGPAEWLDFNAKLGGFGLVKYCRERSLNTRVMGTIGYAAPEYLSTGHLSTKCDIYSFGVVLLESMSGRRALDRNLGYGKQNLVDWASKVKLNRKNVKEIMDPGIQHNYPLQGASECFALALRCVAKESKDRPSSEEVLQSLEQIYALSK